jgi:hypothetical protein
LFSFNRTQAVDLSMKLAVKRVIKAGLMGGRRFELMAKVDSDVDLSALFKGFPDELLVAYRSAFADKSVALKRGELIRGAKFQAASLNELLELEERLQAGFEQLKRMVDVVRAGDTDFTVA